MSKRDIFSATGHIENDIYTEVKQHTQHRDMSAEIQRRRLHLLEMCRKRAAA